MTIANWYTRKPYIHFDLPLSEKDAVEYVSNPENVASHPFYPLISYDLVTPRTQEDPNSGKFVYSPKKRPIAYPSHKDGYIFSFYKSLLDVSYSRWLQTMGLGDSVTAFRQTGKNNVRLAKDAFEFIRLNPGCLIVATDVEKYFEKINHMKLKQTWARFIEQTRLPNDHYAVYKAITKYSTVERYKVYNLFSIRINGRLDTQNGPRQICTAEQFRKKVIPRKLVNVGTGVAKGEGIPQGTSISPLLSNMYLADLDLALHSWVTSLNGKYWRYCDDILLVIPPNEIMDILSKIDDELGKLALTRSKEKTHLLYSEPATGLIHDAATCNQKQLQYLGLLFNGNKTTIRASSIHRYHRKSKRAITVASGRQHRETKNSGQKAPFRKRTLYNMYSDLPLRGRKTPKGPRGRRNFIRYLEEAAKSFQSAGIRLQKARALRRFRNRIRMYS